MKPNLSGTWRLNAEKSKLLGPGPTSDIVIVHREPHFESTMLARRPSGEEVRIVFRGDSSGVEFENAVGPATLRSTARWEGEELKIESWAETPGRKAHFCDYWFLAGANTLVMEHRDDDLDGQRSVLERVPSQ